MVEVTRSDSMLTLAVRELADFACREGDLERGPAGPTADQGRLAHQRLQKAEPGLQAEVALSRVISIDGIEVRLTGRIDLVDVQAPRLIEIKSTLVPVDRLLPGRRALDQAQLALYAWLWLGRDDALLPDLEMRYVNLRDDRIESVYLTLKRTEIEALAIRALQCRVEFEKALRFRRQRLRETAADALFPHGGLRASQRTLAAATYRSLRDAGSLVLEAPTGSGKSLGTLYPAMKILGEGRLSRIVWLTAKRSGRESACQALDDLRTKGLEVGALVLRSRRAACPCEQLRHDGAETVEQELLPCDWTLGYHARLRSARQRVIESSAEVLDGDRLDQLARENRLCPHAFACDLLAWMPVVICDYNHLFDPLASVSELVEDSQQGLLIDEAHNLPQRGRSMFSQTLTRAQCRDAATRARQSWPALARAFDGLARAMSVLASRELPGRSGGEDVTVLESLPEPLVRAVKRASDALSDPPEQGAGGLPVMPGGLSALAIAVHRMTSLESNWLSSHRCLLSRDVAGGDVAVRIECLDACEPVGKVLKSVRSAILMSATLTPLAHFRDMFGLDVDTPCLSVDSPFRSSQWHCQLVDWIPVRYAERQGSTPTLADLIRRVVSSRVGHYLVFLPSFAYLESVHAVFDVEEFDVWRQPRSANPAEVAGLLARLDEPGHSVGFVIAGGTMGEGVDYRGDRLIGAIVVGVGLPPPSLESDLAIDHHKAQGRNGYDAHCRYPGLVRVLQSAGRVVRSEHDRGVVILVDSRFNDPFYRTVLPRTWELQVPRDVEAVSAQLQTFWNSSDSENDNACRITKTGQALAKTT